MSSSAPDPGLQSGNAIINGDWLRRPLPKTCGPVCIVTPLYVLLNLESLHPEAALRELPRVLGEHSGHTTVYVCLSAPSVMEGYIFLELHGYWKSGLLQSSFPGLAEPVSEDRTKPIAEHWYKYDGLGNLRQPGVKTCHLDHFPIDDEEPVLYEGNYYHAPCVQAIQVK